MAAEDLARSLSRRMSIDGSSSSRRRWTSVNLGEVFDAPGEDLFNQTGREEDEQDLKWAAIERLPTYNRLRQGMIKQVLEDGNVVHQTMDVSTLGAQDKKNLLESILKVVEEDNERFLQRVRSRTDRVGIAVPKVEVRFQNLSVEGDAYIGSRSLPTVPNAFLNTIEDVLRMLRLAPSMKKTVKILSEVNGVLKPSRLTLLLGPPGSGRTTLLKALAGVSEKDLRVTGQVTYCGRDMSEFIPQKTSAYISQHDLHHGELTVRETLDFSGRVMGVGTRYDLLSELSRREINLGIKPDAEIDAFMKATALSGQHSSLVSDYVLKILGLDICADIMVGDVMRRGISGGQKKRVTAGEMLVGPAKVLFMDEISTGLDSSTTFQIVKYMRQMVHIMDVSMIISLLQPPPETFDLFDDIILLSEGQIIYQGPRDNVLEFFESVGFKCPERKGVADFLQEVTSRKDQEQYWYKKNEPYHYVSVPEFVLRFGSFHVGQRIFEDLSIPYDRAQMHPAALVKEKYGISNKELLKASFAREWLLMKRSSFLYIFKTFQMTIMSIVGFTVFFKSEMPSGRAADGAKFYGALFFGLMYVMFSGAAELNPILTRLPVYFKQRDSLFFPAWAFAVPIWILRIPISVLESFIWTVLTYYTIGFAPDATRFLCQLLAYVGINQMALSLFRFIAAVSRIQVVASALGTYALLLVLLLGGFIVAKDDIVSWMKWGYYVSPLMYGQNAIAVNEFLDERWNAPNTDTRIDQPTIGKVLLASRGMFVDGYMYWICVVALFAYSILFNILFILALKYLNPFGGSKSVFIDEDAKNNRKNKYSANLKVSADLCSASTAPLYEGTDMEVRNTLRHSNFTSEKDDKRGMVLPFKPLSLAFEHINYYVDMPPEMKRQGIMEDRLQLLRDVSGAFKPGVLTALVGVSGAGKTTLMDVLAGRKTGGVIEGSISILGYPKNQATFARVSGYCEQNDIHSPHVTIYESLVYSAWLRLGPDVSNQTQKMFVEEVMELIELNVIRDALVGLPGVNGLSTEQRKRLTIAVELVANPSIIFMDEPTSGLDARAAAIVMRTVRNTVDTGRTVVCTIHQPSIDIFESFDELLLMKRGGQVVYAGPLGHHSCLLVQYFESISGISKCKDGENPATWMLEVSSPAVESQLGIDFAQIYEESDLHKSNLKLIEELSKAAPGSQDLHFPTKYAQSFVTQCKACFWKQHWSYWRHPEYNAIRFFMTIVVGMIFGFIFWGQGQKIEKEQDLFNLLGAMYASVTFFGGTSVSIVQAVVAVERTVFYRERAAGMYSALPYAFAQVGIEVVYIFIQTFVYSLLLFTMIGFPWQFEKFLLFFFFVCMCFVYFALYGMMLVALTPNFHIAAITMTFFLNLWNLFSGFLIHRTQIPIWCRWYYWGSPLAWTINGVIISQLGDNTNTIIVFEEKSITVKEYLKDRLGYESDFLGYIALAHIGWALLFGLVFAYGIKFLNFQRR